jgi:predicted nuclease with TOPRIM domain
VKVSSRPSELSETAQDILSYLAEHPQSQDTLEGVTQWWLLEQEIKKQMEKVQAALDELIAEGSVLARRGKDGRTHYHINRRRLKEIRSRFSHKAQ